MRAVGYFTYDPRARKGPGCYQTRYLAFRRFCKESQHLDVRFFADPYGEEGLDGWGAMTNYIRQSGLAYLVVVPNAQTLGSALSQQVDRVLEVDALGSQAVCIDPNYPDPLQNALQGARSAETRRERIRQGMIAKAAKGLGLGKPPYGYRILVDGSFAIVPHEAENVRLIFKQYLESGGGVRAGAAALNEQGLRTRAGGRWSLAAVRDILRNPAYIGAYRRFGFRIPGSYEPIVAPSIYRKAQKRLTERSPGRSRPRRASFLLSGILFCGHCGGRMMGVTRRQSWLRKDGRRQRAEYRYYQCQSRVNRNECDYHTTRADPLEEEVVRIAREKLAAKPPVCSIPLLDRDRAYSAAQLRAINKRFINGVERAASGKLTLGQLRAGSERLTLAKDALAIRAAQNSETPAAQARFEDSVERFITEWDALPHEERRYLIRLLVAKVTLKDNNINVALD